MYPESLCKAYPSGMVPGTVNRQQECSRRTRSGGGRRGCRGARRGTASSRGAARWTPSGGGRCDRARRCCSRPARGCCYGGLASGCCCAGATSGLRWRERSSARRGRHCSLCGACPRRRSRATRRGGVRRCLWCTRPAGCVRSASESAIDGDVERSWSRSRLASSEAGAGAGVGKASGQSTRRSDRGLGGLKRGGGGRCCRLDRPVADSWCRLPCYIHAVHGEVVRGGELAELCSRHIEGLVHLLEWQARRLTHRREIPRWTIDPPSDPNRAANRGKSRAKTRTFHILFTP